MNAGLNSMYTPTLSRKGASAIQGGRRQVKKFSFSVESTPEQFTEREIIMRRGFSGTLLGANYLQIQLILRPLYRGILPA